MTEGFKFRTIGELHTWVGQQLSAGSLSADTVVKTSDLYGSTNSNGGGEAVIHSAEGAEPMTLSIYGDFA